MDEVITENKIEENNQQLDTFEAFNADYEAGSLEDKILSTIPGLKKEDNNVKTEEVKTDEQKATTTEQTSTVDSKVSGDDKKPAGEQKQAAKTGDKSQVIDKDTNEPVPTGAAQRLHQQREQLRQENALINNKLEIATRNIEVIGNQYKTVVQELQTVKAELEIYRSAYGQDQKYGLDPEEVAFAKQIGSAFKKDPIKTVQSLIASLRQQGYNIEGLGSNADMQAVAGMIDQRLAPITQQHQQTIAQQQAVQEAERVIRDVFTRYPEAQQHVDLLREMIAKDDTLTLEQAYLKLWQTALSDGYDITKPLVPQIQAREAQKASTGAQQKPAAPVQHGVPNTRPGIGVQTQPPATNSAIMDNGDIVRQAMREHGFQF